MNVRVIPVKCYWLLKSPLEPSMVHLGNLLIPRREVNGWQFNGDVERPTFTPSVLERYGDSEVNHYFVTDGRIQFLADCTHELAGQTVDLPVWTSDEIEYWSRD